MTTLTPDDVQKSLDALGLDISIQLFEDSTATSQQAADAIGCELGQIAKSLAFLVDGNPILIVACGDQRVDDRKLAALFEVGRKKVRAAKPEQCVEIYGYAPGGVPPIGIKTPDIPVYIDDSMQRYTQMYAAAGAHNAIFPIPTETLIAITNGTVMDLKKE